MNLNRSSSPTHNDLGVIALFQEGPRCDDVVRNASLSKKSYSASNNFSRNVKQNLSWKDELYAAETFSDGFRAITRVVPFWVPVVGFLSALGIYYATFRVRLFISQWRLEERRRAERKYELLESLRGVPVGPVGSLQPLGDDDVDEEDEVEDDETAVSMRDIEEFRSSLGIRLPRDEDLLSIVERMLMVDPIPDGWVLYRTAAGIIRFMNLNTQELFFFHPSKRKEKAYIDAELKKRNRQAMESKYNFYSEDEGFNLFPIPTRGSQSTTAPPGPLPIDFGDDGSPADDEDTQSNAFKRLFHYFLEREQKRIEQDVARSRSSMVHRAKEGAVGLANVGGSPGSPVSFPSAAMPDLSGRAVPSSTAAIPHATSSTSRPGAGAGGATEATESGQCSARSLVNAGPAMTYRVVLSSALHGGRTGNVKSNI